MPRRAPDSQNLIARLRAWFGLRQEDVAFYAGVSPELVQAAERGRRSLTRNLLLGLLPLLQQLPPPPEPPVPAPPAPPTLAPGTSAPDAATLDFRRRVCRQQAGRLRTQAGKLAARALVAEHWAQALPALLAAYPAPVNPTDPDDTLLHAGIIRRLHHHARPLPAEDVTRWHLLQARIVALEAEAAALDVALG